MIKNILFGVLLVLLLACTSSEKEAKANDEMFVEILEPEGAQFFEDGTAPKVLADVFLWTEGPLWIADGDFYLFSDIPNNKVFKIDLEGEVDEYLWPSGYTGSVRRGGELGSNGLLLNPQGELVLMQHGDRKVVKMNASPALPKADYTTLVDNYDDKRLNSPNDGVFDMSGNLYFTDPPYGLLKVENDSSKELSFQGVYCLKTTGELILVDSLSKPNGIGLSPDEKILYVAVSDPKHAAWYAYDLSSPGEVSSKRIFADFTEKVGQEGFQGLPDGLKVHTSGYLFATGPGGIWVFSPEAKPVARIQTGQSTANCEFGKGEKELFITADDYVMSIALK